MFYTHDLRGGVSEKIERKSRIWVLIGIGMRNLEGGLELLNLAPPTIWIFIEVLNPSLMI